MVDRLRALLDRPLDPRAGRAIVVLATAISFGFAAVVVVAGTAEQGSRSTSAFDREAAPVHPTSSSGPGAPPVEAPSALPGEAHRCQDPQDDRGSTAGRHAERALRSHRAFQHVPFHGKDIAVTLIGARHGRALLLVVAPTVHSARRGWRRFLRRFDDTGSAYVPVFRAAGDPGRLSRAEADRKATLEADQGATHLADQGAGPIDEGRPATVHHKRNCAASVLQRSPLHIEVCS